MSIVFASSEIIWKKVLYALESCMHFAESEVEVGDDGNDKVES